KVAQRGHNLFRTEDKTEFKVFLKVKLLVERHLGRIIKIMIPMSAQTMAQKIYDLLIPVESPGLQPFLLVLEEKRQHLLDAGPGNGRKMQNFPALAHLCHHIRLIPLYSRSARRAIAKIASYGIAALGTPVPAGFLHGPPGNSFRGGHYSA